jgi:phosphatidylglycerol---prolipoprotein diacylglyceryl transferase
VHPRLFEIGHFILPTYGVILAFGLTVALLVFVRVARLLGLDTVKVSNLAFLAIVVMLAAGKILLAAAFWRRDGMRALGLSLADSGDILYLGIATAAVSCWLYARRSRLPVRRTADALAPALAVGSSVAFIACFESGCGYGTPTRVPWAVIYTSPFVAPGTPIGVPLHPTQIYASLLEYVLFVVLLWFIHRPHGDGEVMGAWLYLSGLCRYFLGFLRADSGPLLGSPLNLPQLIAIGMVLAGGSLWLQRRTGVKAPYAV